MADAVMVTKIIEVDVRASADASAHLKSIADGVKGIEDNSAKAGSALSQLTGMVKGFVGFQIFQLVGDKVLAMAAALQEASDKSKVLEQRMKLITSSSDEAGKAFESIIDIAGRQGRELDGVAKLYERITRSSSELALSQKGVALITEGVAASLRLAGAGTQEANAAMLQFSQAMASGKLGGDEFRSLMENDSILMQALAKQLGTTTGGLREMSKEGKLTADVLRNAFVAMGSDGQNMMQRMIEMASKLPKTFDQAVNGSKAALIDLVNAMQQTSEKGEGYFTRLVERISKAMRASAQLIRDHAEIEAAIARALGKKVEQEIPEAPDASKRAERIFREKADADKQFIESQRRFDDFTKLNVGNPAMQQMAKFTMLSNAVKTAAASVQALQMQISKLAITDTEDERGNQFTTGKVTPPPPKAPKEHGAFDTDVFKQIQREVDAEKERIAGKNFEKLPWEADAAILIRRLEDARDKMTKAQLAAAEQWIKSHVEDNYYNKKEAEFSRFIEVEVQKSDERQIGADVRMFEKSAREHDAAVKKAIDAYNKEHLTKDPFEGADELIKPMRDLMMDARTTEEQANILASAIHAIHEKAAKQLLGEKEPLKDVAHQMGDVWESEFNRMEDNLLDFSKSVKDIIGDMVLDMLKSFAKIEMNQTFQPLMNMGKEWIQNDSASFFANLLGSANGNVFPGGIRMFARGGVLDGPTPFMYNGGKNAGIGGENGPGSEALVPLKRGADGNLGVAQAPVQVVINNNGSNTKATAKETQTSGGGRKISVMVEDIVESSLGSGRFDNTMAKSFGVSRRGN